MPDQEPTVGPESQQLPAADSQQPPDQAPERKDGKDGMDYHKGPND